MWKSSRRPWAYIDQNKKEKEEALGYFRSRDQVGHGREKRKEREKKGNEKQKPAKQRRELHTSG